MCSFQFISGTPQIEYDAIHNCNQRPILSLRFKTAEVMLALNARYGAQVCLGFKGGNFQYSCLESVKTKEITQKDSS